MQESEKKVLAFTDKRQTVDATCKRQTFLIISAKIFAQCKSRAEGICLFTCSLSVCENNFIATQTSTRCKFASPAVKLPLFTLVHSQVTSRWEELAQRIFALGKTISHRKHLCLLQSHFVPFLFSQKNLIQFASWPRNKFHKRGFLPESS